MEKRNLSRFQKERWLTFIFLEFTITVRTGWYLTCIKFQKISFSARYWDDPHKFNPSRFLKDWPRDAFLPFSAGKEYVFSPPSLTIFLRRYIYHRSPCMPRPKVCFSKSKKQIYFFLNRLLFDQILRDWRHSSFNHARFSVQDNGQRGTAIRGRDVWRNEVQDLICYTEIDLDVRPDFFFVFLGITKLMLILILSFCFFPLIGPFVFLWFSPVVKHISSVDLFRYASRHF